MTTRTYDTGLGAKRCDAEGLGYDAAAGRLLIACKKEGKGDMKDRNPVYAFDLAMNALMDDPVLGLDPDEVPGNKRLRPSALAVHPLSGQTIVLSSRRESLVVLDADGSVAGAWSMEEASFAQPEGLAFLPNGDVLISSEAGKSPAVVARFAYAPER